MRDATVTVGGVTFGVHSYLRGAWEESDGVAVRLYDSTARRDRELILPRRDADRLLDYFWEKHGASSPSGVTHCPGGN